ncbi:hypothetical protein ACIBF5_09995 [Micromonospora sp. NPDC050417]|uniref:hypothetical protein n=1 Tax=Micromonospora sp. NPDC050417 TaxID=3364280 RepID=UPI00378F0EB5
MRRADLTPLGQIETEAISRTVLTIPSTVIDPDTPAVPLLMLDFRLLVIRSAPEARDRAWRHLGELARTRRGDWNLYALGVAYPHLRAQVNTLTRTLTPDRARQVHFTLAIEFLLTLHDLDLTAPRVFPRLTDTALTRTSGRKRRKRPPTYDLDTLAAEHTPISRHGNPEPDTELRDANRETVHDVLDRLTREANDSSGRARITPLHADLIRRTYLDGKALRDVAAELNISETNASKQRKRTAHILARLLGRDDLVQPTPPRPRQPRSQLATEATPQP